MVGFGIVSINTLAQDMINTLIPMVHLYACIFTNDNLFVINSGYY